MVVDARRLRLGMVLERLLPEDEALSARVEALMRDQAPHIRAAFRMERDEPSWFERLRW